MPPDRRRIAHLDVLAPTVLEYCAARCTRPPAHVSWTGVGLQKWQPAYSPLAAVSFGLAGALVPGLPPGTILVPEAVGTPDGRELRCDPDLRDALISGARSLSQRAEPGPLLTAPSIVTGAARQEWVERGFVAADMETGLLAGRVARIAVLRVVLDTPERSLSELWVHPVRALVRPALWGECLWLFGAAPLYALRAARVLKAALELVSPSVSGTTSASRDDARTP